jgi:hypothetical protein
MQLAGADFNDIIRPSDFIIHGKQLALCIRHPPDNITVFVNRLNDNKRFFPKLFSAFHEKKTPLRRRTDAECTYLGEKLLEDMQTNVAAARAELSGEKLLGAEVFPSDPDEGIPFLDSKEDLLVEQMKEIESAVHKLGRIRPVLERIQKSSRELEDYDESFFVFKPLDSASHMRPVKKPRNG